MLARQWHDMVLDVELLPRRIQCIIMIMYFLVVFVNCACLTMKKKMMDWRPSNAYLGSDEADEENRCDNLRCNENCSLESSKSTRLSESEAERQESDTGDTEKKRLRFCRDVFLTQNSSKLSTAIAFDSSHLERFLGE